MAKISSHKLSDILIFVSFVGLDLTCSDNLKKIHFYKGKSKASRKYIMPTCKPVLPNKSFTTICYQF